MITTEFTARSPGNARCSRLGLDAVNIYILGSTESGNTLSDDVATYTQSFSHTDETFVFKIIKKQ
jgi:hypothetical protein